MRYRTKLACVAALVMAPAFGAAPAPYADKDVIEYRKHIMHSLNEQSKAIGQILATTVPADDAAVQLESLALTASVALKAFEPKVQGGEANAVVWSDWTDFAKRMNEFAQKTSAMAKVAREKGKDAGMENIADALSCKSCHDIYRSGVDDADN
jgi:cytochrome c556